MERIKALFFDVDSTLYTHRVHDLPASTKDLLIKAKKKGYKVGFATSRCRYETKHLPSFFREYPFDVKIYDGGSLIIEDDKIIQKFGIDSPAVEKLIAYCHKEKIPVRYSTYDKDCLAESCDASVFDKFFKLYLNYPLVKAYEQEEVFNMLAYPDKAYQVEQLKQLMQDCYIVEHSANVLEFTAKACDKGTAVAYICEKWGIPLDDIVCFGDGANDVGMLTEAGLGIAMGNGNEKAKQAADRVCEHIDEDGLYKICEELKII